MSFTANNVAWLIHCTLFQSNSKVSLLIVKALWWSNSWWRFPRTGHSWHCIISIGYHHAWYQNVLWKIIWYWNVNPYFLFYVLLWSPFKFEPFSFILFLYFLVKKTARYHRLLWKYFDDLIPGSDFPELDTHGIASSVLGIIVHGIRMYREKNPILKLQPLLSFLHSSLISF
jgi:hypothetical protein